MQYEYIKNMGVVNKSTIAKKIHGFNFLWFHSLFDHFPESHQDTGLETKP